MTDAPAEPTVRLERLPSGVAILQLYRPEARNALNLALRQELAAHFTTLSADPAIRCIVIRGDEKAFAAGADVRLLVERSPAEVAELQLEKLWAPIEACTKPVIAAVTGFALGAGCELALIADIVVAGENAKFGLPEIKLGIMPGAGGVTRLQRTAGKFVASYLAMTGQIFSGRRAYEIGMVSELVADDQVIQRATEIAGEIAALPPLALAAIKDSLRAGADLALAPALAYDRERFQSLFATADQKEGMRAFLDKRPPNFQGK